MFSVLGRGSSRFSPPTSATPTWQSTTQVLQLNTSSPMTQSVTVGDHANQLCVAFYANIREGTGGMSTSNVTLGGISATGGASSSVSALSSVLPGIVIRIGYWYWVKSVTPAAGSRTLSLDVNITSGQDRTVIYFMQFSNINQLSPIRGVSSVIQQDAASGTRFDINAPSTLNALDMVVLFAAGGSYSSYTAGASGYVGLSQRGTWQGTARTSTSYGTTWIGTGTTNVRNKSFSLVTAPNDQSMIIGAAAFVLRRP